MAFYRQNQANGINQDPRSQRPGTRSYTVYAPEERQPDMGAPNRWTPFGVFQPHYDGNGRAALAGRWDGLRGMLMDTPQADFLNSQPNPWPANGVYDEPNAAIGILPMVRLQPTTSAHPGAQITGGIGPSMLFHAPPVFGMQTKPILALGV